MGGSGNGSGAVVRERSAKLKSKDIVSTRSLVSERESKRKLVDDTLKVFKDAHEKYGVAVEEIQLAKIKGASGASILGYYDGANIAMNERFFNDKVETAYVESVKRGFHPSNGKKTGLQAVMAHEVGHHINQQVANKMNTSLDESAKVIVGQARKEIKQKGVVILASKISRYATTSNAETIAEAYSDVYCNGRRAKRESKAVMKVVDSYFK